jgi:archaemetzincin
MIATLTSWDAMGLLGATATAVVLVYRLLWRRLCGPPTRRLGDALRIRGRIVGAGRGLSQIICAGDDGCRHVVELQRARISTWPGPGAWRWDPRLRVGDPITLQGFEGDDGCLHAVDVARGAWPEPRWPGLAVLASALLALFLLVKLIGEPPPVEQAWRPTGATLEMPDRDWHAARHIRRLVDRTAGVHDWQPEVDDPAPTFLEYIGSRPALPGRARRALYLQPVGSLGRGQRRLVEQTGEFLALHLCLPVKLAEEIPVEVFPRWARRLHPEWGTPQLLTTYLLHHLLRGRLPFDAAGYLAMTPVDIWPGPGWETVNGQASPVHRVGVLSTYRSGDPDADGVYGRRALLRTLKVAAHEAGHMLSMHHCANRACIMSGHNDRTELDQRRLVLCPDCLAKLLWATGCDAEARQRGLAAFFERHGVNDEADLHRRIAAALAR